MDIQYVKALLSEKENINEGRKFSWLQELRAADQWLNTFPEDDTMPQEWLVTHARILESLGNWVAAEERWQMAITGARNESERLLAKDRLEKVRLALGKHEPGTRFTEEISLFESAIDNASAGEITEACTLLERALMTRGLNAEQINALTPLFTEICRLLEISNKSFFGFLIERVAQTRRVAACRVVRRTKPTPVFLTSGFGWSGSGAVTDWLHGFSKVVMPFGRREMPCFELAAELIARDGKGTMNSRTQYTRLVSFLLGGVLGFAVGKRSSKQNKYRKGALLTCFVENNWEIEYLTSATVKLISVLEARYNVETFRRREAIVAGFRSFFDDLFRKVVPVDHTCLLNNSLRVTRLHGLHLFPSAKCIVVTRDPRDQYVARWHESRNTSKANSDCSAFIEQLKRRYDTFAKLKRTHDLSSRICQVSFELFVTSEQVRTDLLKHLNLESCDVTREPDFQPEVSQKNIGIHRGFERQSDIQLIEDLLCPYLDGIEKRYSRRVDN